MYSRPQEHMGEISTCTEEDRFYHFYQLSCNHASDCRAAENFIMDPVEAEQNCKHSFRNTRAFKKTRKWRASQEINEKCQS